MKNRIKDYFTFNKAERNGVILLLFLIFIIPFTTNIFSKNKNVVPSHDSLFRVESEAFLKNINTKDQPVQYSKSSFNNSPQSNTRKGFNPFLFDPNTATLLDFMKMGFSEKQAESIINYRTKGGTFNKKEDFAKLYVVDDKLYKIFEPYISINKRDQAESDVKFAIEVEDINSFRAVSNTKILIEINNADSMQLLSIKGIGPVFASRILKYRNRLGGFCNKEQLKEVYGIDSTRYPQISEQVRVDTSLIRKIDINIATLKELQKHPYLSYYTAKSLIDKRIQSGRFNSISDVEKAFANRKEIINKLRPYIEVK